MSLFFYLFTLAINLWHRKFVSAYVTAVGCAYSWLRGTAVQHRSLADVLSLSCAQLVADG